MSVLQCERGNCQNIMCSYRVLDKYYICNGCRDELILVHHNWTLSSKEEVWNRILDFMETNPGNDKEYPLDDSDELEEEFRRLIEFK